MAERLAVWKIGMLTHKAAQRVGINVVWGRRRPRLVHPWRFTAYHMARLEGHSLTAIARPLGYDHTTVLHGLRRYEQMMAGREPGVLLADGEVRAEIAAHKAGDPTARVSTAVWQNVMDSAASRYLEEYTRIPKEELIDRTSERLDVMMREGGFAVDREMLKLRRLGWSLGGIARRYGEADPGVIASKLGERYYEREPIVG
jgi:hypothetical protein